MATKTKQDRTREVFDWLQQEFPTRRACSLTFKVTPKEGKDTFQGYVIETHRHGIEVVIDSRLRGYTMIDTLLHEYSHIKSRRTKHGVVFRAWEERIDSAFWDWRKRDDTFRA